MEKIILALTLCFSNLVSANTVDSVFLKDSLLPKVFQQTVLDSIKTQCPQGIMAYNLKEVVTTVTDYKDSSTENFQTLYITQFETRYYFDGYHPTTSAMEVKSVNLYFYENDSRQFKVESLNSEACNH